MQIIGVTGKAGSGKDTAADYLVSKYGFVKYSLAQPLKDMLKVIGINPQTREEKEAVDSRFGVSPRAMMQTLGTEWMRDCVNRDGWLILAREFIDSHMDAPGIIIPDIRFQNEVDLVHSYSGGKVIKVWRPRAQAVNAHVSESPVESDAIILNVFDIAYLESRIDYWKRYYQ